MKTYVTVIRQLGDNRPVLMARIDYENIPSDVDYLDHYAAEEAMRIVQDFTNSFVEFKNATFCIDKYEENGKSVNFVRTLTPSRKITP